MSEQDYKTQQEPASIGGRPAPESVADTQAETSANDQTREALAFLNPADKPGVLGRLGRYEVLEVIGKGGMGIVLRAYDEQLNRMVAIKVLAAHLATSITARKRFSREARAAAAVCHDHLVTIHAVEETRSLPYLVMGYVPGLSLQQRLDREGPLPLQEIVRIGMETAQGLAAAHAKGLIHRDIKPANLLLEGEPGPVRAGSSGEPGPVRAGSSGEPGPVRAGSFGEPGPVRAGSFGEPGPVRAGSALSRVKITDFGLARAADDSSLTQTGVVAGTPDYMSPEQACGEDLDQRTDLFSLGSVLYAMCTGQPPFHAGDTMAILHRVCEETPTPIRQINPDIPDWLVAIVDKLHAKVPALRFQSAGDVVEVLSLHLAHLLNPSVLPYSAHPASGEPKPPAAAPHAHKRRWAVAAILVLIPGGLSLTEATGVTKVSTFLGFFTRDDTRGDDPVNPEGANAPGAATTAKQAEHPFVLLTDRNTPVGQFETLAKAVAAAGYGDTIEIHGNGPFHCDPIDVAPCALTIRAGSGFTPVIRAGRGKPLLSTDAPLTVEGLDLELVGSNTQNPNMGVINCSRAPLHIANCRFRYEAWGFCVVARLSPICTVRNCQFTGPAGLLGVHWSSIPKGGRMQIDNCVMIGAHVMGGGYDRPDTCDVSIHLTSNTVVAAACPITGLNMLAAPRLPKDSPKPVTIDARGNVFDGNGLFSFDQHPNKGEEALGGVQAEDYLRRVLDWREQRNLFAPRSLSVAWYTNWRYTDVRQWDRLSDWDHFWRQTDSASLLGEARFLGGDLSARLHRAPEKIVPADFRLRPDSPGYRGGKDGKDLGADVDLVGPGKAYERWKKTPEYQQWLKTVAITYPNDISSLNNLAWGLVIKPDRPLRDVELAVRLAEKARQQEPNNGQLLKTLGLAYYRTGKWKEAAQTLARADKVGANINQSFCPFVRAMADWKLGKHESARKWYAVAIVWLARLRSNDPVLLGLRTEAAALLGLPEQLTLEQQQAVGDFYGKYLTLVIEADPEAVWAYHARGRGYAMHKEWDKAIPDYSRAVALLPQTPGWKASEGELWIDQAEAYLARKEWAKAEANLSRASAYLAELAARPPSERSKLAYAYLKISNGNHVGGRVEEAKKALQQALSVFAKPPANLAEDRAWWEAKGHTYRVLGFRLGKAGRTQEAIEVCRRAIDAFAKAATLAPAVANYWHGQSDTLVWIGNFQRTLGQNVEAEKTYRQALTLCRKIDADGLFKGLSPGWQVEYLNDMTFLLGEKAIREETREAYQELISILDKAALKEHDPLPRYRLALVHLYLGHKLRYRTICSDMLTRFGNSSNLNEAHWTVWTCVLAADGVSEWKPVVNLAEKCLAADPESCDNLLHLGAVLYRAGRFKEAAKRLTEAEAAFQKASKPRSSIIYAWLFQAMTQAHLGQAAEARKWLDKAVQAIDQPPEQSKDANAGAWNRRLTLQLLRRELAWTCLNLGKTLEKDRHFDEAMKLYRRIGALYEKLGVEPYLGSEGYGNLALLLAAAGRAQEAEQACRKLLDLKGDGPFTNFRYALLRLHLDGGDAYRKACADMLSRFRTSPDLMAAYWTAWTCTLTPDAVSDWKPVVELTEKSLAADLKNCDRLQIQGAVLYRAGRFKEALRRLTEAEAAFQDAKQPRSTVIYSWLFLAMTQHRLGQTNEARRWFKKAVEAIDKPPEILKGETVKDWSRRLTLQLWRREAEALLGKKSD